MYIGNDADTLFVRFDLENPSWKVQEGSIAQLGVYDTSLFPVCNVGRFPFRCDDIAPDRNQIHCEIARDDPDFPDSSVHDIWICAHTEVEQTFEGEVCPFDDTAWGLCKFPGQTGGPLQIAVTSVKKDGAIV